MKKSKFSDSQIMTLPLTNGVLSLVENIGKESRNE